MKKIKKTDLRLEKEVITSLSAQDQTNIKGGSVVSKPITKDPENCLMYTKDNKCILNSTMCGGTIERTCLCFTNTVECGETKFICQDTTFEYPTNGRG